MHTVMVQNLFQGPATQQTAKQWKNQYKLAADVLWDPDYTWVDKSLIDIWSILRPGMYVGTIAFPWYFYIHTANMRVWDMGAGLFVTEKEWVDQEIGILDYCAEESRVRAK